MVGKLVEIFVVLALLCGSLLATDLLESETELDGTSCE